MTRPSTSRSVPRVMASKVSAGVGEPVTADASERVVKGPSRSQKKRDAHALADLGRLLTKLKRTLLMQIPLDEEVREAVLLCQTMEKNAHARQLRRIAKVLAQVDVEPTLSALRQRKLLR